MQRLTPYVDAGGEIYDLPDDQIDAFRERRGGERAYDYRLPDGREYSIPESQAQRFSEAHPDAQPMRRLSFADGSSRSFTGDELRKFFQDEYITSPKYKADRDEDDARQKAESERETEALRSAAAEKEGQEESERRLAEAAKAAGEAFDANEATRPPTASEAALQGGKYVAKQGFLGLLRAFITSPMRLVDTAAANGGMQVGVPGVLGSPILRYPEGAGRPMKEAAAAIEAPFTPTPEEAEDVGPVVRGIGSVESTVGGLLSYMSALKVLGPMGGNTLMSAEAGNDTYISIFDNAVAQGADPATAHKYAMGGGAVAAAATAAIGAQPLARLAKLGKPVVDAPQETAMGGFRDFTRQAMKGALIRHAEKAGLAAADMGGITFAEGYGTKLAQIGASGGDPTTLDSQVEALYEAMQEGGKNAGIAAILGGMSLIDFKNNVLRQTVLEAKNASQTPEGRQMWAQMFPEGTQNIMRKRLAHQDISRADIEKAGYPKMSQEQRNALGDQLLRDYAEVVKKNKKPLLGEDGQPPAEPTEPKPTEPPPKPPAETPVEAPVNAPPQEGTTTTPAPAEPPRAEEPAKSAAKNINVSAFVKAQREAEADGDFEGDRGLADLVESLPPEKAQELVGLWSESSRLRDEADSLIDGHGRLSRTNQTEFDTAENERKHADLWARARDLQNEANKMLLREAEANGWEQGEDAETGGVRWVKKPAEEIPAKTETGGNQGDAAQQLSAMSDEDIDKAFAAALGEKEAAAEEKPAAPTSSAPTVNKGKGKVPAKTETGVGAQYTKESQAGVSFPVGTVVKRADGRSYKRVEGDLEELGRKEPKWIDLDSGSRPAFQSHVFSMGGGKVVSVPAPASEPRAAPVNKGKVPAKKPKPVKADPKKAAKAVEGFVATDPTRKTLMHVHHDHEGGVAVATDGRVLIATKHGYDKNAKDDPEAPYPNWRQVVPDYDGATVKVTDIDVGKNGKTVRKQVELPVQSLETDPASVSAACKKAASLAKSVGHDGAVYASLELPDGGRVMMDPAYLRKVADAMGANGITEIRAVAPNRPIVAKNDDTTIVAMPLRGGSTDAPTGRVSGNPLVIDAMTGRILTAPERSDNTAITSRKWADELKKQIERGKKDAMDKARKTALYKAITDAWKNGEKDPSKIYDGFAGEGEFDKLKNESDRELFVELLKLGDKNALAERLAEYEADHFPQFNRWRKDLPREVAKIEKRIAAEDEIDALMAGEPPPAPAPKPVNKGKGKKAVQAAKALGSPDAASPLRPAPKGAELVQGGFDDLIAEEIDGREGTNLAGINRLVQEAQDSGARPRGRQEHFNLSKTPEAIKGVLPGEYFTVKAGVVLDHYGKDADHSLSPQDWVNISEALHDPLVIAKYSMPRKDGTRYYPPNSFRVWVEALVNGHMAMVGVEVKSPGRDVNVNSVSTVYGDEHVSLNPDDVVYSRGNGEGIRTLLGGPNPREYSGSLPASEPTIPVDKTSRRPSAGRGANNSASRAPFAGDNAEGNSPASDDMIPQPAAAVKGGEAENRTTLDGQTIDPTGEKTDKNPLGKALVPKDGSIEQEIDAEIAADEALAAKGGGKPQGVPPAPAPGSAGNPNLDPSYEPEAFGSGIEGNPIARQQVIDKFRELFGDKVAIRGKNTRTLGPTVAGHFEPDAHIIRSKDPISLRTIPHEIGHFIDALLRRRGLARPPAVRHDLIALGKLLYGKKQPNGGYESEGFAELLKYYMQGNDAGLRKDAPAAYDWFMNKFAPANPDTMARIDAMRDMIDRFQNQSAVQAVRGISAPDRTLGQKIVDRIADAANALKPTQENWIDKGAFITKAMKASGINRLYDWRDALKRGDVAEATRIIENHPVLKWKLYNGKAGMRAFVALKDGLTDLSGTRRYTYGDLGVATPGHAPDEPLPTFREIFGDFTKRELDDFKHEYAIARVAKELYLDRGLEFGLTEREVNTVLRKYANNAKFREALDRYTHYKHGVLHLLVDAGAMSQQQFEAIVDANPIYAKIARRRESTDFFRNAMLRRGGKAVNERKGGGQMIEDIFDAGLVDDERIFRAAFQADLFRSLVRAGELAEANNAAPGGALQGTFSVGANWIKEVPNAKEAVTFTPEKLRKQVVDALNAAGAEAPSNVAGQPPLRGDTLFDALFGTGDNLTIFKERPSDGKNGIVSIYGEDGKLRTFELPENNAEGWAKGLLDFTDGKNASIFEKWAEISVAGVRAGATMLNPEFALRNLMRDTFHAATMNQHGTFIPVVGSIEGLYHDLMGTAPKQMFEAMGLEMGGMLGRSRLASARKSNQYLMSSNWLEAQMRKGLTKAVADLVGVTENATRIKQFKLAYENMLRQGVSDKAARMIAGCNALDTTIDFLRSGYTGQKINRIVPFFNAGVQGLDQFARALGILEPKAWDVKDSRFYRLGRTLLQGLAFLATAALFSELYNRSDPERKRKAEELPPHERWNYISFGDLRIPVPYEAGYLFASIPRAVAAAAIDGDEKAVSECLKMFATTFPLQVDSLHGFIRNTAFVGSFADVAFNEDWKYKTIVQQHVKDGKESWEWYGPRTTGFSKDLGKALHNVIGDSYFSAPAYLDTIFDGYTGGMYSKLARLAYGEADFSFDTSRPSDWPVVGTFFRRPESSRIPNDFYDERAKLERKAGSGTATIAEYGRLSAMDSIAKDIRPYWDANRRLMADRDMPRKERLDRMDENTRKATDAIRAMSKDESVMRSHGMKALAAKLANPTATGDSWERAAKMLKADGATLQETQSALRLYGRAHGWSKDTVKKRLRLLTARW